MKPRSPLSRRHFLRHASLAASGLALSSTQAARLFGQTSPASLPEILIEARKTAAAAKITVTNLRGNINVLMGSGGNIAVLSGPDGKLLVDSGYATSQPQVVEALAALPSGAKAPVSQLINTHWHFDHTDGNEYMHRLGATITAHQNCQARLSSVQTIKAFNATFPPSPAGAIPTVVITDTKTISLDGQTIVMRHYKPAHTDGDISVYFTEADILHTGDTLFNGFYPFIDYSSGGSIDGMIAATATNIAATTNETIIIPGHGPLATRDQMVDTLTMLTGIRANVAALKAKGMTLEQTVAANPTADFDEKYGKGFMKPAAFTGLVYQGV